MATTIVHMGGAFGSNRARLAVGGAACLGVVLGAILVLLLNVGPLLSSIAGAAYFCLALAAAAFVFAVLRPRQEP